MRYCITSVFLLAIGLAPAGAQVCHAVDAADLREWTVGIEHHRYTRSRASVLDVSYAGALLTGRVAVGQTFEPSIAATVPEIDVSSGLRRRLPSTLDVCIVVGIFGWFGPRELLLADEHFASHGGRLGVGASQSFAVGPRVSLTPFVSVEWSTVRTTFQYNPMGTLPDSTVQFSLRAIEVGIAVALDRALVLRASIGRPHGMPTDRFAPVGRKNGEMAITVGAAYALRSFSSQASP